MAQSVKCKTLGFGKYLIKKNKKQGSEEIFFKKSSGDNLKVSACVLCLHLTNLPVIALSSIDETKVLRNNLS